MITTGNLPADYRPFSELTVCGNRVTGGGLLFVLGDAPLLLVGQGSQPMIWLQAPTTPGSRQLEPIVESSISKHPAVSVISRHGFLDVQIANTTLVRVQRTGEQSAAIDVIDLRPIGLNITGDPSELRVAGSRHRRSSFSGGTIFQIA
jgi:hypothetical protein